MESTLFPPALAQHGRPLEESHLRAAREAAPHSSSDAPKCSRRDGPCRIAPTIAP